MMTINDRMSRSTGYCCSSASARLPVLQVNGHLSLSNCRAVADRHAYQPGMTRHADGCSLGFGRPRIG